MKVIKMHAKNSLGKKRAIKILAAVLRIHLIKAGQKG